MKDIRTFPEQFAESPLNSRSYSTDARHYGNLTAEPPETETQRGGGQSGMRFPSTLIFTACPVFVERLISAKRLICLSTRDIPFFSGAWERERTSQIIQEQVKTRQIKFKQNQLKMLFKKFFYFLLLNGAYYKSTEKWKTRNY